MQKKFDPWLGKMSWKRKWQPTPVFSLHGKFHGQRRLEGYSPWDCQWSDTTWACTHQHQCTSKAWVLVSHFINVACSWSPSRCKCMKMTSCKQELPFPGRGIKTYPVTVQTMWLPILLGTTGRWSTWAFAPSCPLHQGKPKERWLGVGLTGACESVNPTLFIK